MSVRDLARVVVFSGGKGKSECCLIIILFRDMAELCCLNFLVVYTLVVFYCCVTYFEAPSRPTRINLNFTSTPFWRGLTGSRSRESSICAKALRQEEDVKKKGESPTHLAPKRS